MLKLIMQPTTRHDSREKPFIISSSTNIEIDCCYGIVLVANSTNNSNNPCKNHPKIFFFFVIDDINMTQLPFSTFQFVIYPVCLRCQYEKRKKSEFHLLIEKGKHLTVQ